MNDRHRAILEFLQICDEFKNIERQGWLAGERRRENDAEHTWHMALFALLLADEIEVKVDRAHVLALILVHDLVEIYAGDSYAFDYAGESQHAKEVAAAERLFGRLPADLGAKVKPPAPSTRSSPPWSTTCTRWPTRRVSGRRKRPGPEAGRCRRTACPAASPVAVS